jgi:hypothetical protein
MLAEGLPLNRWDRSRKNTLEIPEYLIVNCAMEGKETNSGRSAKSD